MGYKLNYGENGNVSSIQLNDNMSIPISEDNADFIKFLEWNSEQEIPLDLNSTYFPPKTWDEIRFIRNQLLSSCDWTQLIDSVLTQEERVAWLNYRQALRNVPQDFETPDDVVFPEKPQ